MHASYEDGETLRQARRKYFDANGFGETGGYEDAWVDFSLGPIPMPFPNMPGRRAAVGYHDLHHVLTGYETTTRGEFEISAWEIGAGCKRMHVAWVINLGGLAAGAIACPVRALRAFARGRRSDTLYGQDLDAMLDTTVGDARARFVRDAPRVTSTDALLFGVAVACGVVVGGAFFAVMAPLVPIGIVLGNLARRRAARVTPA